MFDLDLLEHTDVINELLARYGVKFGIFLMSMVQNKYLMKNILLMRLIRILLLAI